jgi:hypothetical protein
MYRRASDLLLGADKVVVAPRIRNEPKPPDEVDVLFLDQAD